jgi:hypothetical protein
MLVDFDPVECVSLSNDFPSEWRLPSIEPYILQGVQRPFPRDQYIEGKISPFHDLKINKSFTIKAIEALNQNSTSQPI